MDMSGIAGNEDTPLAVPISQPVTDPKTTGEPRVMT
jgi:hypothetical protein